MRFWNTETIFTKLGYRIYLDIIRMFVMSSRKILVEITIP